MTPMKCTKCGADHEVDISKIGWSTMCGSCRQEWGTAQRAWMSEKHKEMVKKRRRILRAN
jgi:predicted Zn-ribbon and HTH transcriptional regulator